MANPKKNTYLQLQEAKKYIAQLLIDKATIQGFTFQQCLDIAQIALNEEFGFGAQRNQRFAEIYRKTFVEYAKLCTDDSEDDPHIVYTIAKLDAMLRQACGEIKPFEERYDPKNYYFLGRHLEDK